MTTPDRAAVRNLYGSDELRPLFAAARHRIEERDLEVGGSITLRGLADPQRVAIARVLGAGRLPEADVRVTLADLDGALRRQSLGLGLAAVLEALSGPLAARREARRRLADERQSLLEVAAAHPAFARHPGLDAWIAWVRARGVLARLDPDAGRILLLGALDVLEALPAAGVSLPVFAGRVTGATHALDRGTPLAVLVDRALASLANEDPAPSRRRELWSRFGVTLDAVSSTAIALNLRATSGRLAPILGAAAEAGEPVHVTLRMLRDLDALVVAGPVFLCENRSVIEAAADELGPRSAPLVCLSGEPSAAGRELVRLLAAGGSRLRYHGDFDPDGIAIANSLIGRGLEPWRYGAEDYLAAVARTPVRDELGPDRVRASWDSRLADAMAAIGARIYEEHVLDDLLADLAAPEAPVPVVVAGPDEAPDAWVAASRTRNWLLGDPVCDWLRFHGEAAGFVRDDALPGYDHRTDFRTFILEQGVAFEAGVMQLLRERVEVRVIAGSPGNSSDRTCAGATVAAMREGVHVIAQGVLHDGSLGVFGMPDLLVRADVLAAWFPGDLEAGAAELPAPALGTPWHYRVVDVKFHRFELLRDGHASGGADSLPFLAQAWLYNRALGAAQGYLPPSAYLLGRGWVQGEDRGRSCLERLARVDDDRWFEHRGASLEDLALRAVAWVRRLRAEGATWSVLPEPSVPELRPNMRRTDDAPWHAAKRQIAAVTGDLTLLPRVNPDVRAVAHALGIRRWDDPRITAERLGIRTEGYARRLDAVLAANRLEIPDVPPATFTRADPAWRTPAPLELFVDFETVSDLDDDFSRLPEAGGQPLIFQVGCGYLDAAGAWRFAQWTTDRLTIAEEGRILSAWLDHVCSLAAERDLALPEVRLCHWSAAEVSTLESAYNAARTRHPDARWPDPDELAWFDLLERVARAEPLTVTGAFGFGLKAIAKAMAAQGFIETRWGDGPTDGLGAMVGAWWCDAEARRTGVPMTALPLMGEIARYNEVDCRVMAEVLAWLRANR